MIRKLLFLGPWALAFSLVWLLPDGAGAQTLQHNDFGNCNYCHSLHGQTGPTLLKNAEIEALCLSCHGAGTPVPPTGSNIKVEVHKNETTGFAPFRITCLRCHNPHDNMGNWLPGHTHSFADPPGYVPDFNTKLIGRPYPGAPSVSNGRTMPLAAGAITADPIFLPPVVGGLTFVPERPAVVTDPGAGLDFVDGGGTADDSIVRNDGGDWLADGYQLNDPITISTARDAENEGTYIIVRPVSATTLSIQSTAIKTPRIGDDTAVVDGAGADAEIHRAAGSWAADGYVKGARISVGGSGAACFDGDYTVTGASAATLFIEPGSLLNHGRAGPSPQATTGLLDADGDTRTNGFDFVVGTADPADSCPDGNDCVVRNDGRSWTDVGYRVDCQFTIANASNAANNGTFTVVPPSAGVVWRDTLTVDPGSFCNGNCGRNDTDDDTATFDIVPGAVDPGVSVSGVVNTYEFPVGYDPARWFVVGQGILVTGFTNPSNNGFAIVEALDLATPAIVVRPYRIDPATGDCGDQGGSNFPRPCQLLPDPVLSTEAGTSVQIRSSATYLSVELNPNSDFYSDTGDPIPDNDPDGEQLAPLDVDFIDGGTGLDTIVRLDGGSFKLDGYRVGLKFPITGATDSANNQTFTVAALTDTTLEVEEQVAPTAADTVTVGGPLAANPACLSFGGGAGINCCYTSGRRQVVFEHRPNIGGNGPRPHAFADLDRDFLVGPARLMPDPLLRRGAGGAGGQEFSTGRWDTACGENCHSFVGNHRKDCQEDPGLPGQCDTSGSLGKDEHNTELNCQQCHSHSDGFARGQSVTFTPAQLAAACKLD